MEFGRIKKQQCTAAAELEAACLDTAWSAAQIEEAATGEDTLYLCAAEGDELCAVASCVFSAFEAMVENVAVSEKHRRKGLAAKLMELIAEEAVRRGAEQISLEVASKNSAARALYTKAGFVAVGVRKGFYRRQNDDALVMIKEIKAE